MSSEFKISLVQPRVINKIQHESGAVLAQGKIVNGLTLDKVISALVAGKAKLVEVPEIKTEEKKR